MDADKVVLQGSNMCLHESRRKCERFGACLPSFIRGLSNSPPCLTHSSQMSNLGLTYDCFPDIYIYFQNETSQCQQPKHSIVSNPHSLSTSVRKPWRTFNFLTPTIIVIKCKTTHINVILHTTIETIRHLSSVSSNFVVCVWVFDFF